jgi:hypothetical protein
MSAGDGAGIWDLHEEEGHGSLGDVLVLVLRLVSPPDNAFDPRTSPGSVPCGVGTGLPPGVRSVNVCPDLVRIRRYR